MALIYRFLFPSNLSGRGISWFLFALRLLFGLLLMAHGVQKWADFDELCTVFPNPLGIGSALSLVLVIFAELFCSLFFVVGYLYRLAMIPMIFNMMVAFFVVHGGSVMQGELAFIFLVMFILLYITGPGRICIDRVVSRNLLARY